MLTLLVLLMALCALPGAFILARFRSANFRSELGAVVVTYTYPVAGTVPPTAVQGQVNACNATVAWLDADTVALITHNFGLAATDPAALFPFISISVNTAGTALPIAAVTFTNTNSITLTKSTAAGSGGTINVQLLRPQSMIR